MKRITLALILGLGATIAQGDEFDVLSHDIFRPTDVLAQRDEWGLVHQGPRVNATDFAPRYRWRWIYYLKAPEQLVLQPAYVGSMQAALRRLGYYCGPVDGVYTGEVAAAIDPLRYNHSTTAHGTLTDTERRALDILCVSVLKG